MNKILISIQDTKLTRKILLIILFSIIFIAIRIPYYENNIRGEEGIFAEIFINHPEGPKYLQIARIDGKEIFTYPNHASMISETISFFGKITQTFFDFSGHSEWGITIALRFFFSLFHLFSWLLVLIYLLEMNREKWYLVFFIFILSITPIAFEGSVELNIDNSVGVLFTSLVCFSLLVYEYTNKKTFFNYLFVSLSCLLFGFGKTEWSVGFAISLITVILLSIVIKKKTDIKLLFAVIIGLVPGNLINYLVSPYNYLDGLSLLMWYLKSQIVVTNVSSNANIVTTWLTLNLQRLPKTLPIIILIFHNAFLLVSNLRKTNFTNIFLFILSSSLFFAFSLDTFGTASRLFLPSFFSCVFTSTTLVKNYLRKRQKPFFVGLILVIFVSNVILFPEIQKYKIIDIKPRSDCVYILGIGTGYIREDVNYISSSLGRLEGAIKFADDHGVTICE